MKKILLIFLLPILLYGAPSWFFNIEHDEKCEIVGYGMDKELDRAKQSAISDITHSISVSVDSSVNISSSDIAGRAKQDSSVSLKTHSKAILSGIEFVKVENENGLWYVGALYDNSPLEIRLKKLLPANLKDERQNRYLRTTWGIKSLNAEIGKKLNYKIVRKDNFWQLKYRDILILINQNNFYKFFANKKSNTISLLANKSIYRQNDEMFFNVKHKNKGYISILYVEHNGKVGLLLANHKSDKSFRYPDSKNEEVFRVANPYNKTIRELYVAIYSKTPINLYEFENVSENLLDESNYNFNKLIYRLDSLDFSTFVIKIKK